MPLLVQRVGRDRLYAEAVESHIGGWFWNAAARARVNPVAQPEYEYDLPTSRPRGLDASRRPSQVQPKPEPADWTTLEVPKHEVEVPEEAVQAELETLQRTVAELVPVEGRPAQEGDTVVVDLDRRRRLGPARLRRRARLRTPRRGDRERHPRARRRREPRDRVRARRRTAAARRRSPSSELKERVLPPLDDELARGGVASSTRSRSCAPTSKARLRAQIEDEIEGLFRAAAVDELVRASNFIAAGPLVEARTRELLTGLARSLRRAASTRTPTCS